MTRTLFRKLFPASLPFPSPVTTRAIFYAAVLLGALSCALAAHAQTLDCAYTYASAANEPSMTYCISPAGNVTQFQIPTGNELIANNYIIDPENVQVSFEGYGICNESPVASYINYMDLSPPHGSVGWDAPKVLLSTPTVYKISLTTADGNWTLTQTFTAEKTVPALQIAMALHNNTKEDRVAYLARVGVSTVTYRGTSTQATAMYWFPSSPVSGFGTGIKMANYGTPQFGFMNSYVWGSSFLANPCNFAGNAANDVLDFGSGIMSIAYVDTIGARKTKTATIRYSQPN